MKNIYFKLTAFIFLLCSPYLLKSQDIQGKAYYKSQTQMSFQLDSTQMSVEQYNALMEQLKSQLQNDYVLLFDKIQSSYTVQEKLEAPTQNNGMRMIAFTDESSELYKNTKEKRFTSTRNLFGKEFLVKDELQDFKWKLTKESKQIGQYTCYKATTSRMSQGSRTIDSDGNETRTEGEEIIITSWYTPEIPISNGPDNFWGLPGLILEVHDGNRTLICTKISLSKTDIASIKEPSKGKEVSEEEFEALMDAKMQEMQKMEEGGKSKGRERHLQIRIDG